MSSVCVPGSSLHWQRFHYYFAFLLLEINCNTLFLSKMQWILNLTNLRGGQTVVSDRLAVFQRAVSRFAFGKQPGVGNFLSEVENHGKNSLKKFSPNPRCQPQMISFLIENKNKDKDKIKFIPRLLYYMNHPNQVTRIFPPTIPQSRLKWHWNQLYFPIFNGTKFIWVKQMTSYRE